MGCADFFMMHFISYVFFKLNIYFMIKKIGELVRFKMKKIMLSFDYNIELLKSASSNIFP